MSEARGCVQRASRSLPENDVFQLRGSLDWQFSDLRDAEAELRYARGAGGLRAATTGRGRIELA